MLFNSVDFLVFFPLTTVLYFLLPHRYRWILLLSASCYFYMSYIPIYIFVLLFIILLDYVAAIQIEDSTGRRRKIFLVASLTANVGLLAVFKYWNFFNASLAETFRLIGLSIPNYPFSLLLPLGLSFHTFQSMSYTIEVYRSKFKAERHLGIYALYVMFYPQLVSGPIERPNNLLPQFRDEHRYDPQKGWEGLCLVLWGFFKKIVVADRLSAIADSIFDHPSSRGLTLLIGVYAFAYQIYCDFSGYTDIARGAAKILGFELMENFDFPYAAESIAEFWRKWHISLSSWLRDYLYIPMIMSGATFTAARNSFYLLLVFSLCGLWHGANWTFVLWGVFHGAGMILYLLLRPSLDRWKFAKYKILNAWLTFQFVACGWIFFRAASVHTAVYIFRQLLMGWSSWRSSLNPAAFGRTNLEFKIACASVLALELIQWRSRRKAWIPLIAKQSPYVRAAFIYATLILILGFGQFTEQQFIYFNF